MWWSLCFSASDYGWSLNFKFFSNSSAQPVIDAYLQPIVLLFLPFSFVYPLSCCCFCCCCDVCRFFLACVCVPKLFSVLSPRDFNKTFLIVLHPSFSPLIFHYCFVLSLSLSLSLARHVSMSFYYANMWWRWWWCDRLSRFKLLSLSLTLSLISVRPNADFRQDKRTRCCCKMQFCNVIRFAAAIRFVFLIFFRCCSFLPLSFVSLSSRLIYLTVRDYKTLVYPPYFVYHFSAQSYALSLSLPLLAWLIHLPKHPRLRFILFHLPMD